MSSGFNVIDGTLTYSKCSASVKLGMIKKDASKHEILCDVPKMEYVNGEFARLNDAIKKLEEIVLMQTASITYLLRDVTRLDGVVALKADKVDEDELEYDIPL